MSVKKLLVLSAAGVASIAMTSAFAGGVDQYQAPTVSDNTGLYIEGNLGYAQTNVRNGYFGDALYNGISYKNKNGGWTFGADVGYQFMRYLALEVGGFYLPTFKATGYTGSSLKVKSWAGYGALKVIAPVTDQLDLFAKGGIGYMHVNASGTVWNTPESDGTVTGLQGEGTVSNWDPMFAVGADYNFTNNLLVNATLTHFQGKSQNGLTFPSANLWTVGIGYKFAV